MKTCSGCGRLNPDVAASCKCGAPLAAGPDRLPAARDLPMPAAMPQPVPSPARTAAAAEPQRRLTEPAALDGFDEEAWRAVIGPKNQDWYLERFRIHHDEGGGLRAGWHWPALFITWYWLLYRKMWGWAVGYIAASYAYLVLIAFAAGLHPVLGLVALAGYFVLPPLYATSLYYRRCARLVTRESQGVSRDRFLGRLEGAGGTARVIVFVVIFFVSIGLVGMLAAIALPAYQDYVHRAKVAEAAVFARSQVTFASEAFTRTGRFPDLLQTPPAERTTIEGAAIDPQTGTIEVRVQLSPRGPGGAILYVPDTRPSHPLTWSCEATGALAKPALKRRACLEDGAAR